MNHPGILSPLPHPIDIQRNLISLDFLHPVTPIVRCVSLQYRGTFALVSFALFRRGKLVTSISLNPLVRSDLSFFLYANKGIFIFNFSLEITMRNNFCTATICFRARRVTSVSKSSRLRMIRNLERIAILDSYEYRIRILLSSTIVQEE